MQYQVTVPVEIIEKIGERRAMTMANRLAGHIEAKFGVATTFCGKTRIEDPEGIGLRECIDAYANEFWQN